MSYTNETTHYGIPLPLGTDLTTPMDYNESMEAVDTAVWGAVQDAATATSDAADAKETAQGAAGDVATLSETVTELGGTVTEQGQAITGNTNAIGALKTDVYDMISSDSETSATATHQHLVGDLFIYNDTLYVATAQINVGDTIVPNTNCNTTTIEAQLGADSGLDGRVTTLEGKVSTVEGQLKASNATAGVTDVPFRFGCNDAGEYGYILTEGGADTVIPFSRDAGSADMVISYTWLASVTANNVLWQKSDGTTGIAATSAPYNDVGGYFIVSDEGGGLNRNVLTASKACRVVIYDMYTTPTHTWGEVQNISIGDTITLGINDTLGRGAVILVYDV